MQNPFEEAPFHALFLYRDTRNDYTIYQTTDGLYDAGEYPFVRDPDVLSIMQQGGSVAIGTYTDVSKIEALLDSHNRRQSRCPFVFLRNAEPNDVLTIVRLLEKQTYSVALRLDRAECYAAEYKHFYPEL